MMHADRNRFPQNFPVYDIVSCLITRIVIANLPIVWGGVWICYLPILVSSIHLQVQWIYICRAGSVAGTPLCREGAIFRQCPGPAGHFEARECIAYIGCRIPRQSGAGTGAVSSDFSHDRSGKSARAVSPQRLLSFFALSSYNAETDNTSTTIIIQKVLIKWKIPLLLLPNKKFTFTLLYSHHIDIFFWLTMWSRLLRSNPLEICRYQPHYSNISAPHCIIIHCNVMYL